GKSVSQGCVRLQNKDVEKIFDYVNVGDRVKIYSPNLPDDVKKSFSFLINFYDIKSFIEGSR
ncbi:MAG: L,D-transpeptidase, partial [Caldisericia bacterium]|nr:L,D-transpeptidase [Caldisericia bacterium]